MGPEASAPSSSDVVRVESSNGPATHHVFEIKRKSKNGEARQLQLADVSPLFGRLLPDAAKELGMSPSSLKKACRFFGLHRWPGRKVRGLESAIDGVERALVGQGADAGMRSEIPKLQQELDELYHGTPAQIKEKMQSPAEVTKRVYKRLYYAHDWRSEHHNPGRHDINGGNQPHLTSGMAPVFTGETSAGASGGTRAMKQRKRKQNPSPCANDVPANQPKPNAEKESPRPSTRTYIRPRPRRRFLRSSSRLGCRETELKASDLEGLLPEVHDAIDVAGREVPESSVQAQNGNNMLIPKTEIGEEGARDVKVEGEDEIATVGERSDKRFKTCSKCGLKMLQGDAHAPALV